MLWQNLQSKLSDLISRYLSLQEENYSLQKTIKHQKAVIKDLEEKLNQEREAYITLKTSKMLEVTDSDIKNAKGKINHLIKKIDTCIALLQY